MALKREIEAFAFVKSKKRVVQLKRNTSTVARLFRGNPTESATVDVFRKVKNEPLMRV